MDLYGTVHVVLLFNLAYVTSASIIENIYTITSNSTRHPLSSALDCLTACNADKDCRGMKVVGAASSPQCLPYNVSPVNSDDVTVFSKQVC